uniref:Ribosome assembly factor mrt4 n=2 Tax=Plectus sambesii TaxID=2011161 RepID=A0A914V2E4_9BILA
MPKSKRDKDVSLTKVKKKTKESKVSLVEAIRVCVDEYKTLFMFTVENMRTTKFVQIRQEFKRDSRFFFGKNNIMAIALGRTPEDEYKDGLHKISKRLVGQCGLMFTNRPINDVIEYFANFKERDYARAGHEVDETITLSEGPLEHFPFSMEPQLRKLGLPTQLQKGVITLYSDFVVCTAGDKLTPDQSRILKLLEKTLATFRVTLIAQWTPERHFEVVGATKTKSKVPRTPTAHKTP